MPVRPDKCILLLGESVGAVPCPKGHGVQRLRPSEWPPRGHCCELVVLGGEAMCRLEPGDLDLPDPGDRLVLLCPAGAHSLRRAEVWVEAGYRCFVGPDALSGRLDRAAADLSAAREGAGIDPGEWAPRPVAAGSLADRACRKLIHLSCSWHVQGWAVALGWGTKQLGEICREAFGLTPKEVLRSWIGYRVRKGRRISLPWHCLARILGYYDCSNLLRGLRRSGRSCQQAPRQRQDGRILHLSPPRRDLKT